MSSGVVWTHEELDEWSGGDPDEARELVAMTADPEDCEGTFIDEGEERPCEKRFGHNDECGYEWFQTW